MRIKKTAIKAALDEIRNVQGTLDQYCLAPGKIPVSMDDLTYCIEQQYEMKATMNLVPLEHANERLRGAVKLYENRADIYVDSSLNLQWKRYVYTKELGHIMLNNTNNHTDDPTEVIELMIQEEGGNYDDAAPPDVESEWLAKMVARELLFPNEMRAASREELQAGTTTLFQLSEQFLIPESVVEICIGSYMDLIKGWRQGLNN